MKSYYKQQFKTQTATIELGACILPMKNLFYNNPCYTAEDIDLNIETFILMKDLLMP